MSGRNFIISSSPQQHQQQPRAVVIARDGDSGDEVIDSSSPYEAHQLEAAAQNNNYKNVISSSSSSSSPRRLVVMPMKTIKTRRSNSSARAADRQQRQEVDDEHDACDDLNNDGDDGDETCAEQEQQIDSLNQQQKQNERVTFSDDDDGHPRVPPLSVDSIKAAGSGDEQFSPPVNNDDEAEADDKNIIEEAAASSSMPLSPRHGVSFREEFANLPDFSPPGRRQASRSASPALPFSYRLNPGVFTPVLTLLTGGEECGPQEAAPFFNVTLSDFVGRDVPVLIGELPSAEPDYAAFWTAVNRLGVCGVVTVNLLRGGAKSSDPNSVAAGTSLPWPSAVGVEAVYERKVCARTLSIESFRSFQSSTVQVQDLDYGHEREVATWSFTSWPTSGHNIVPPLPHFFLDFLRTVIQQTYFSCRAGHPLLIVDRNGLDIAGMTAAVVMLLYQACEQRRADVFRCVADLRGACRRNIVSKFAMYEFLYDCLLQVMCATPTIMSGNFKRAFRHLLRRGPPLMSPRSLSSDGPPRRVAPILEQFELICKLSAMYRGRVVANRTSLNAPGTRKRSQFEARSFKSLRYVNLPSFTSPKHFIAVRGIIDVNVLLELMAKRYSRTLMWFSETPRPDEILTGNQHEGVSIGDVSAYGVFYTYELEAPTARGPWRVTVVQFVGWPAFSGERPARPCRELILTLRRVLEHADAVASSFTTLPSDPPISPVVTIYEAEAGCSTWRGAMAALAASLDQRMCRFLEVDIFRTAQMYKIFDPDSIVISPKQYTWCFKMAWSSYLWSNKGESDEQQQKHPAGSSQNRPGQIAEQEKLLRSDGAKNMVDPYGSDKYLYSYPALSHNLADFASMANDGEGDTQLDDDEGGVERPIVAVHRQLLGGSSSASVQHGSSTSDYYVHLTQQVLQHRQQQANQALSTSSSSSTENHPQHQHQQLNSSQSTSTQQQQQPQMRKQHRHFQKHQRTPTVKVTF